MSGRRFVNLSESDPITNVFGHTNQSVESAEVINHQILDTSQFLKDEEYVLKNTSVSNPSIQEVSKTRFVHEG